MKYYIYLIATAFENSENFATNNSNQIQKLIGNFGIDLPLLLAQIFNFCIVAGIIYYFCFKRILTIIDLRRKKISEGLQYAEDMKNRIIKSNKQYSAKIIEATIQGQRIIAEAKNTAQIYNNKKIKEANKTAEDIIKNAQKSIILERKNMLIEVRKEIKYLIVATSKKVLNQNLKPEITQKFNEAAAKEIHKLSL